MKTLQIALVLFGFCSATAFAQAKPEPFCAAALKEINLLIFDVEVSRWMEIGDDSVHRANLNKLGAANSWAKVGLNLSLMRDARCKMPTTVIDESIYADIVKGCVDAKKKEHGISTSGAANLCRLAGETGPLLFK